MLLAVLLAFLAAAPVLAAPASPPTLQETMTEVSRIAPRTEGSTAERELLALIRDRLNAEGLAPTELDFSAADFAHSFSRSIRVDIPGASPDTLILAVPIDTPPDASTASEGSVNVALALDLIARLRGTTPPLSMIVLFLGAERGDTADYPLGSNLFVRDFRPEFRAAVLYLDLRDAGSRVDVRIGAPGIVTPYWLVDRCAQSLRAAGVTFDLPADEVQLFRMGTTDEHTMIEPWLTAGYPAVGLRSGAPGTGDEGAAEAALSRFLESFVAAGTGGVPEGWDRHYLLLQAAGLSLILGEGTYVGILVLVLCAAFLYALSFIGRLRKYLRTLARNAFALVPLAVVSFVFLLGGTAALQAILLARGFDRAWAYDPLGFLALKACVALFLYAVLYNLFRRLPFPRNGSFYSAASILILLVDILVIAAVDISFTWYFLWAFVFVLLSTLVPNRWAKVALFLPAPFWGLRGVFAVLGPPALPFVHLLLLSPLWGNLLIAGACLPFVLVLLRLGLVFPGRGILRRRRRELVLAGILLAAGTTLAVRLMTFSPFSAASPQPVTATQTIDVDARGGTTATSLDLESPAPLGMLSVNDPGGAWSVPHSATTASMPLPRIPSPVTLELVDSSLTLDQRNMTVRLSMPASPRSLTATLTSDDDFILIDSSFPSVRESPRDYRLLVGAYPPNPVALDLSLPTGGTFLLTITLELDEPLIGVTFSPARPDLRIAQRVRVVRRLELHT